MIAILCGALSLLVGWLGRRRRFGFWGVFIASIFFNPIVVLVVLIVTAPDEGLMLGRLPT